MNLSGRCIARLASRYDLAPAQVLIVHDDLDLAVGRVKLKQGGSDGGHNGLRSTTSALRSDGYWRLRVGIGRPACKADVAQYVLDTFHRADQEAMRPMIASIVEHAGELPAALEDAAARSRLLNALSRPAGAAGSAEGREGSRSQKRAIDAASAATGASAPGTVAEDAGTAAASTSGVSTGGPAPADVAQGPSLEPPAKQREQSWGAQSLMGALSSPADDSELHVAPGVGAISPGRAGAGAVTGQDEHHEERKPQVEIQSSDEPPAAAQGGKP